MPRYIVISQHFILFHMRRCPRMQSEVKQILQLQQLSFYFYMCLKRWQHALTAHVNISNCVVNLKSSTTDWLFLSVIAIAPKRDKKSETVKKRIFHIRIVDKFWFYLLRCAIYLKMPSKQSSHSQTKFTRSNMIDRLKYRSFIDTDTPHL